MELSICNMGSDFNDKTQWDYVYLDAGNTYTATSKTLLYSPYPMDRGISWFYVEAARHPPPTAHLPAVMILKR